MPNSQIDKNLILLTAFEPSGDDLGGAVVQRIREIDPSIHIAAWGGPRLHEAGAEIIEDTSGDAVMGIPGPRVIAEHIAMHGRISQFMRDRRPALFVAVDSPAANFPVCKKARACGIPICHIAAPQLWAWAPWRIRKLRRLTDRLLCLLPFEEEWFTSRDVPATFIGHPVFDAPLDPQLAERRTPSQMAEALSVALFPGSRVKEQTGNFPMQLAAFRHIQKRHPRATGSVACINEAAASRLQAIASECGGWPKQLTQVVGDTEGVIASADICLAVSGTVTLHIARQVKPMIVTFRTNRLAWNLLGSWLIRTPLLAMPNLVAGKEIVPELMPYFGDESRLVAEVDRLLENEEALAEQRAALRAVCDQFAGRHAADKAATEILVLLRGAAKN